VSSRWPRYAAAAGIGLVTLATTAILLPAWRGGSPLQRIDAELAARRSIAVMPFADRSATPAPHVAEAVVEEILTDLARMRDSLVISSGSTRALAARGQTDPVQVGRELGVQFVLTGSLQRDAERLQLHVQLARAAGGAVLWSERFDNAGASGQNWQREVSGRIAGTLDVKMHDGAIDPLWHVGRNSEAMDQWMRGAYLMRRYKTRKEVLRAREHFEAALAVEPRSVSALIGLAQTHQAEVLRRWHVGRDKDESLGRAKEYALTALSIDSNHAGALVTLGSVQSYANDFEEAERTLTKALILNPNNARGHSALAGLKFFMGRWSEVEAHVVTALRLNPVESANLFGCHLLLGDALMHLGQDRAREHHLLAALAEPTLPNPHFSMASHAALRGRIEEAKMHLAEAQRLSPGPHNIARSVAGDRSQHPEYLAGRRLYREGLRLAGVPEHPPDGTKLQSGKGSP
jgi:TolB-like protein/Flp pilus assembly protein TadD